MINTIQNIDCLIGMQNIPDKSIDMVFCDLPYGTTKCKWDIVLPFDKLWSHYERVIKDNGAIILTASQPFTSICVMSNMKLFKYSLVYQKTTPTGHLNSKKMPLRAHEDVLVFYKKLPTYNPQKTFGHERKVSSSKSRSLSIERNNKKDKVYNNEISDKVPNYDSIERYPLSVLKFSTDKQKSTLHPTQKPISLVEYFINTYSNEGDLILDNCMGSGTTAIACINTNRNYIGFEKEEKYFNIIQERIKNHLQGKQYPFETKNIPDESTKSQQDLFDLL